MFFKWLLAPPEILSVKLEPITTVATHCIVQKFNDDIFDKLSAICQILLISRICCSSIHQAKILHCTVASSLLNAWLCITPF